MPYYDSAARPHPAIEELRELARNTTLVAALVDRDLKIRYKRSVFGVLWTMVNPLVMLLLLSLAFTRVFVRDAPAYPFFVIPALLLWNFIAQGTSTVVREVALGVDVWRRLRVPKSAMVLSTTLTNLINLLFALVPLLLVLAVARRPLSLSLLSLPATLALATLFVLGVSLLLAAGAVYFPDIADLYGILLPALMFTAPIVYPRSVVMSPLSWLVDLNPVTYYVEAFRAPLYNGVAPTVEAFAGMTAAAVVALILGWLGFTRAIDDVPYQA